MSDSFHTILEENECEIKIQKSKFIANIFHIGKIDDCENYLRTVKKKFHDAKHHPFAYRIGTDKNNFRYNDDGEPSGSSGKPILEAIDKHNLTDVLIIVTRYFGGIKLGIGGLKRAYFESAGECIKKSVIVEKFICDRYNISFDYVFMNLIMNFINKNNINIIKNNSDLKVNLLCEFRKSFSEEFELNINNLTNGKAIVKKV